MISELDGIGIDEGKETREFEGRITFIGKVKYLGESKKLKSIGIKIDSTAEDWHNITGFDLKEMEAILGKVKKGDKAKLYEEKIKGYWNITGIKLLEVVETLEDEQINKEFNEQKPNKAKYFDANTFVKECIEDAEIIVKELATKQIFLNVGEVADMIRRTRLIQYIGRRENA